MQGFAGYSSGEDEGAGQSYSPTPATQPISCTQDDEESGSEEEQDEEKNRPWARLTHTERSALKSDSPIDLVEEECLIGRGRNTHIRLDDSSVSNVHCKIYREGKTTFLRDCNSSNGTYLNGAKKITTDKAYEIHDGDIIAFVRPKPPVSEAAMRTVKNWYELVFNSLLTEDPSIGSKRSLNPFPEPTLPKDSFPALGPEISRKYSILKKLGAGTFASVYKIQDKETKQEYAVKVIEKKQFRLTSSSRLKDHLSEAKLMKALDHPSIARLFDIDEDDTAFYLIMELVRGGELFDRIISKGAYPEVKAKVIIRNILEAVAYLHKKDIVHRDLKPENILLVSADDDVTVKLVDFGVAKEEKGGRGTFCGTMDYVAPEVLKRKDTIMGLGKYGKSADMWSVGVIAYVLLTASALFSDDSQGRSIFSIEKRVGEALRSNPWNSKKLSPIAQDFVSCLLEIDEKKRLNVKEALDHPWLCSIDIDHASSGSTSNSAKSSAETKSAAASISLQPIPDSIPVAGGNLGAKASFTSFSYDELDVLTPRPSEYAEFRTAASQAESTVSKPTQSTPPEQDQRAKRPRKDSGVTDQENESLSETGLIPLTFRSTAESLLGKNSVDVEMISALLPSAESIAASSNNDSNATNTSTTRT